MPNANSHVVTKQLEESNQRYRKLLDKQEQQIIRLEQIDWFNPMRCRNRLMALSQALMGFMQ